ncbi:MAG: alpha/beta fold hydrolase, partial [Pseudonocardiales bacterium]|nr:alpha/beta fold hydrolase [Pseudonocardiales bacterium]
MSARGGSRASCSEEVVTLAGGRIAYSTAGSGEPILLIHGLGGTRSTWRHLVGTLAETHLVIAPDLLGHGDSGAPAGDYSLGAHAAALRDLLVALDLDRATIVGHSFGGGVAMQFAYQFPELVDRLVLIASGGLGSGVSLALRAATLPGASTTLQALTAITPGWLGRLSYRAVRAVPAFAGADLEGLLSAFT